MDVAKATLAQIETDVDAEMQREEEAYAGALGVPGIEHDREAGERPRVNAPKVAGASATAVAPTKTANVKTALETIGSAYTSPRNLMVDSGREKRFYAEVLRETTCSDIAAQMNRQAPTPARYSCETDAEASSSQLPPHDAPLAALLVAWDDHGSRVVSWTLSVAACETLRRTMNGTIRDGHATSLACQDPHSLVAGRIFLESDHAKSGRQLFWGLAFDEEQCDLFARLLNKVDPVSIGLDLSLGPAVFSCKERTTALVELRDMEVLKGIYGDRSLLLGTLKNCDDIAKVLTAAVAQSQARPDDYVQYICRVVPNS